MPTHWIYYLTTWVCIICALFTKYFDVFYLALITGIIGSYISFIEPGYYTFVSGGEVFKVEGLQRFATVDLIHLLIVIYGVSQFNPHIETRRTINTLLLIVSYFIFFDVQSVYHVRDVKTIFGLGILISALYFIYLSSI